MANVPHNLRMEESLSEPFDVTEDDEDVADDDDDDRLLHTPLPVYAYERPSSVPPPFHVNVAFCGSDPPTQSRAVYPAGVSHRVQDVVDAAAVQPECANMSAVAYHKDVGVRLKDFPGTLQRLQPTLLLLCMHYERPRTAPVGAERVLHFAEADGTGVADACHIATLLRAHHSQQPAGLGLACVVVMACDCEALGPVLSAALGANTRVLVTTRTLYQSQVEAWAPGFVAALCRGASVAAAMEVARARVNRECPEACIGHSGKGVRLHVDARSPLFVCYGNGERMLPEADHVVLRPRVEGLHDAAWERVRSLLSRPFPKDAQSALGYSGRHVLSSMFVPMSVRVGAAEEGEAQQQQQQQQPGEEGEEGKGRGGGGDGSSETASTASEKRGGGGGSSSSSGGTHRPQCCMMSDVWRTAEAHNGAKRIVVEGVAGMGKSTIAHMLGSNQGASGWPAHFRAVVVVNLSTLKRALVKKKKQKHVKAPSLKAVLRKALGIKRKDVKEPADWLRSHPKEVVWVLDGYDEVERRASDFITPFDTWLRDVITGAAWSDVMEYVLIMTRPGRTCDNVFAHVLHVTLDPWGEASIRDYVCRFFAAPATEQQPQQQPQRTDTSAHEATSPLEQHALSILVDNRGLPPDFAGIPFICEITCHLIADKQLPQGQVVDLCTLYDAMVVRMWRHEHVMKRPDSPELRGVLSAVALHCYRTNGQLPASVDDLDLEPGLRQQFERMGREALAAGECITTPAAVAKQADSVARNMFAAVQSCWAMRRGGFVHKSIMEFLVAKALTSLPMAAFTEALGSMIHLDATLERMVLVFTAGLLCSVRLCSGNKGTRSAALAMKAVLAKHVTQLMVTRYYACRDDFNLALLDTAFSAREELRARCSVPLAMEAVATLRSKSCNTVVQKAVVGLGIRPLKRLQRILLEPAAHFGNLKLVQYLVRKRSLSPEEAVQAAASAGQSHVLQWCMDPAGGRAAAEALSLATVARTGNHRLLKRLLAGSVPGVSVMHTEPSLLGTAVHDAARLGHTETVLMLVTMARAPKDFALLGALVGGSEEMVRVCLDRLGARLSPANVDTAVHLSQSLQAWWLLEAALDAVPNANHEPLAAVVRSFGPAIGGRALVQCLSSGSDEACYEAARTLGSLPLGAAWYALKQHQGIPSLLQCLHPSACHRVKLQAARTLYYVLDMGEALAAVAQAPGAVAILTACLGPGEVGESVLSIVSRLTNTECGRAAVAQTQGAIAGLVACAGSPVPQARLRATKALANLVSSNAANKALLNEAGGIERLVLCVTDAARKVRHLVRFRALSALISMATVPAYKDGIRDAGGIPATVACLCSKDPRVQERAAWLLANMCTLPMNREAVLRLRGVAPLTVCLGSAKPNVRMRSASALAALAADVAGCEAVLGQGGIAPLVSAIGKGEKAELRVHGVQAIANLTRHQACADAIQAAGGEAGLQLCEEEPKLRAQAKLALKRMAKWKALD